LEDFQAVFWRIDKPIERQSRAKIGQAIGYQLQRRERRQLKTCVQSCEQHACRAG